MIRIHEVVQLEEQISNSGFCQFVIEFLSGTLHESSIVKSLITQARIKCNTFPAVLLSMCSVFNKFKITGLI